MLFSGKENIFKCFGCIMKIVLENIFMCLVTFWKCYFPPPPTPPQQQKKQLETKERKKKSKSHRNVDRFVGRSKAHKKSKSQRERDQFVGSWREGSGSPAKSKAHGSKALGWRSVHGFVDRWSQSQRHDLGSLFFLSLSLSLSLRVSLEMVWSENFDWNQFPS